jgi:hypothetical protein
MSPILSLGLALSLATLLPSPPSQDDSQSAPLARELTALMTSQKLQTVAARDPDDPARFVAAMAFPDVQLLVVSARYAAPATLEYELGKKQYSDIYAALQQSAIPDSKVFIQDLKADGLHDRADAVDVMYEQVTHQTIFDGNASKHGLTQAQYGAKFHSADQQYARLLTLLIGQVKGATPTP